MPLHQKICNERYYITSFATLYQINFGITTTILKPEPAILPTILMAVKSEDITSVFNTIQRIASEEGNN
ncbi:MAG: hypothetical protein J6R47_02895 [Acholeplasmatales bacterium]|nr:hypothetical protein [Acholeplasmatales bacterium]